MQDKYTAEGGIVSDHDVHRKSIKGSAMGASKHVIVGCNVTRGDENATPRYTQWINALEGRQLLTQRYRECTLIKPTWFMSRDTFESVGSFDESGPGTPEDMIFLYKHLDNFGALAKVCEPLVMYRYHAQAQSHSVKWQDIFDLRVKHIEHHLLNRLSSFSVWSAGREGKRFYRALDPRNQTKVACFLDVKDTLIKGPGFRPSKTAVFIPIRHYTQLLVCGTDVIPRPVITCVKLNLHSGFETNMADVKLTEGYDCIYFA
ncbi:hypothetical protein SARC_03783 [Sphaeroforma arctica JP610]|uniref:Glycosyltransferase 2-like domain-containing protein n=1 Tax=Sphaeroforma arctica JP610 TaxID=667725 RepID=A0A0L0G4D9_9EUKA|nr:hypothetical protein SARC_03783 [Sphaeroforma arctica JP610]KNC83962.1 hypothetical protein SARC_03783 [Sphaeroforma arctica JP610]|eukprot:XP_014157864.1 hypothetical protein SARC_03783 [Sphaeroforma arctica JP610]